MMEGIKRPRAGLEDDIRWLSGVGLEDRALVGGKGASLGELMRAGLRVPEGFVLSATAYERFLDESGLRGRIEAALEGLDPGDTAAVLRASGEAYALIRGARMPGSV